MPDKRDRDNPLSLIHRVREKDRAKRLEAREAKKAEMFNEIAKKEEEDATKRVRMKPKHPRYQE